MPKYLTFALLCLVLILGTAQADPDGERAALPRLVHELQALEPLIQEAQAQANADTRIRFQYDRQASAVFERVGVIAQQHATPVT